MISSASASCDEDGWRTISLGELISLRRGHDLTWRQRRDGGVPVMGSAGVNGFHNQAIAPGPGVILGRSGASFGRAHYCDSDFWPHNTALYVTDFRGNHPRYVYYLLSSIDFSRYNSGGAQQSLNRNFIAPIEISVPHPQEQLVLASALDHVDGLLTTLERSIVKRQAIKQGMLQQLLTGRTRLSGHTGDLVKVRLGEVARFTKGAGLPKSDIVSGGTIPCIHYGELFTHYGPEIKAVTSRTDNVLLGVRSEALDVLMPTSDVTPRGLAKASAVHHAGVILGGDILVIRPDSLVAYGPYIAHTIRLDDRQVLRLVRGSTVFHLYASDMKNFELVLPGVGEQRDICVVLRDAQNEIDRLTERLIKARAVKTGMMQQLLTGRTHLTVEAA